MGLLNCLNIRSLIGCLFRKQKDKEEVQALPFGPTAPTKTTTPADTSVLDLMDLSEYEVQYFSLPNPVIKYIFDKSSIIFSQNFIKCCKYFKLLHLKRNESQIDVLQSFDNRWRIFAGFCKTDVTNKNLTYKLKSLMKSIKILDAFVFSQSRHFDRFFSIIEKLDLSQTKIIDIYVPFPLEKNILEKFLNPSLEEFRLYCHSNENVNPALFAFQRCPKIKKLSVSVKNADWPLINKKIFKEILKTKRENRIDEIGFHHVIQIDQEDFIIFLDTQMSANSRIALITKSDEAYNELYQMLENVQRITQKNEKNGTRVLLNAETQGIFFYL